VSPNVTSVTKPSVAFGANEELAQIVTSRVLDERFVQLKNFAAAGDDFE